MVYRRPLQTGEAVPQIEVEDEEGFVAGLSGLLEAPTQVHESFSSARHTDASLPAAEEQALQRALVIGDQALSDHAPPKFADPNRPRGIRSWLT